MQTFEKFQNQRIKVLEIAKNYIQSIEENKQVYFQHPQLLVQLINIDPVIFTDGYHSFECASIQFPIHIKIDYTKNAIFKLKEWNFKIYFNTNSHYLSFEMNVLNIEIMDNTLEQSINCPKLISNHEFKLCLEILKKKQLKTEFRDKTVKKDLIPFMKEIIYQIDNIQIDQKKSLPKEIQKPLLPSIFNKSQKFGLITKNKQQSFKFTNELALIPNQTRLNIIQGKQVKKNDDSVNKIQDEIKTEQQTIEHINEQKNQSDSSLEMYIKQKPIPQIFDIESDDNTESLENCVKYNTGKKSKSFGEVYLKLWQEKLKRRNKDNKYLNFLVDDDLQPIQRKVKKQFKKSKIKLDSSSSLFEVLDENSSDQSFTYNTHKKKKKNNFSKDSIFNLNSIENQSDSDKETQLDEKPSFLKFINDQIGLKKNPIQRNNCVKQEECTIRIEKDQEQKNDLISQNDRKQNKKQDFQFYNYQEIKNENSSGDEIFIFVKESRSKKIKLI